jgi:hypothetical protein
MDTRFVLLFESRSNLLAHIIHIKSLQRWKWALQAQQLDNRCVDTLNTHYKVAFSRLFFINLHERHIPHRGGDFIRSRLEGASLLAGFNRYRFTTTGQHGNSRFLHLGCLFLWSRELLDGCFFLDGCFLGRSWSCLCRGTFRGSSRTDHACCCCSCECQCRC